MFQLGHTIASTRRHLFTPIPRSDDAELLDEDAHDSGELAANFRDIRRVNQLLGGTSIILRQLPTMLTMVPPDRPATVLDLATGCGDIPLAISRRAKRHGVPMRIVASDYSDEILALARNHIRDDPDISLARHDARAVPLPDKHFDIVLCSLSLHHFTPEDAVRVLREMNRLARVGFIINDLRRSRLGYAAAWIAARMTTRNRLTRNDAPLSVRRAFTPRELEALLHQAGIEHAIISTHLWFRMAAVARGVSDE